MENERYKDCFKQLVKQSADNNIYIGTGNPNSKILFVGKERPNENDCKEFGYAKWWINEFNKKDYFDYPFDKKMLYEKGRKEGWMWRKYQKLYECFCPQNEKDIHFERKVFTTEMNINPSKISRDASKIGLQERKDTLFWSDFIQQFSVVVLGVGNFGKNEYLENAQEMYNLFGVTWNDNNPHNSTPRQYYFAHYNSDIDNKTKLVIHTRNLSNDVSDELLKEIGTVIKDFLNKS